MAGCKVHVCQCKYRLWTVSNPVIETVSLTTSPQRYLHTYNINSFYSPSIFRPFENNVFALAIFLDLFISVYKNYFNQVFETETILCRLCCSRNRTWFQAACRSLTPWKWPGWVERSPIKYAGRVSTPITSARQQAWGSLWDRYRLAEGDGPDRLCQSWTAIGTTGTHQPATATEEPRRPSRKGRTWIWNPSIDERG